MKRKSCNLDEDEDDSERKKSKTLDDDGVDDFSESGWIDSVYNESCTNDQNLISEYGGNVELKKDADQNNQKLLLMKESGGGKESKDKTGCRGNVVKKKKDDDKEDHNGGGKKIPISSLVIDFGKYFLVLGNGLETQMGWVDENQETENSIENQESGNGVLLLRLDGGNSNRNRSRNDNWYGYCCSYQVDWKLNPTS